MIKILLKVIKYGEASSKFIVIAYSSIKRYCVFALFPSPSLNSANFVTNTQINDKIGMRKTQ